MLLLPQSTAAARMWSPIIIAGGAALFPGVFGGLLTPIGASYRHLRNPSLQPPDGPFGLARTIILRLAAWSAVIAWTAADARRTVVILFATNAVFHALCSPLLFRARRPDGALVEVMFPWASLVALVVGLWPISRQPSLLIVPYLLWVSVASWLNGAIVRLEPAVRLMPAYGFAPAAIFWNSSIRPSHSAISTR